MIDREASLVQCGLSDVTDFEEFGFTYHKKDLKFVIERLPPIFASIKQHIHRA